MPLLEAKGLTKIFGALSAVNNVDLTAEKGVTHSIIGANGAGKTTLFNLLAGAIIPTRGHIIFQGSDIASLKVHERCKKGIGRSFQITVALFPVTHNAMPPYTILPTHQRELLSFVKMPFLGL